MIDNISDIADTLSQMEVKPKMILSHLKIEMRMVEHQPPMSQGDLARAYGCHQSAMSKLMARIERAEHISTPVVARLVEALGCTVNELLPDGAVKDGEAA